MSEQQNKIEESKFQDKLMDKIRSGRVRLRSKYVFLAEKLGLGSAFVLTVILSALFFNLVLFYMKTTDNLKYLSFGRDGLLAFMESFPYLLTIGLILFLFLAGYLITKSEISYKKPFKLLAVGLVLFIIVAGGTLVYTDISERIEEAAYQPKFRGMIFRPFLERGPEMRRRGLAGVVSEVNEGDLVIQTPYGEEKINIEKIDPQYRMKLEKGQFIIVAGERRERDFFAKRINIMNQEEMPMIRRGIDRRLGPLNRQPSAVGFRPPMPPVFPPNQEMDQCAKKCLMEQGDTRDCLNRCQNL